MGLEELKCKNCGSILTLQESGEYICQHCGSIYKNKEEITNNVINHNETIVQNYYGTATKKETGKKQIDGFFDLLTDSFASGYYADAFSYCNKILNLDSTNEEALFLRKYLSEYRLSPRKFMEQSLYLRIINFAEQDFLGNNPSDRRNLMKLMNKMIDKLEIVADVEDIAKYNFACMSHLKQYFDGKTCNDSDFLELKQKIYGLLLQFGKMEEQRKIKEVENKRKQKYLAIGGIMVSILFLCFFITLFIRSEYKTNLDIINDYYLSRDPEAIKELQGKVNMLTILMVLEIIGIFISTIITIIKAKKTKGK